MVARSGTAPARHAAVLVAILLLATLTRLYDIDAPLLDQMCTKQVYVANRARSIAGPPFDPL